MGKLLDRVDDEFNDQKTKDSGNNNGYGPPEGHGPNGVQTPFIVEDSDIVGGYGGKQGDPPHDDGDNDVEAYVVTYILQKKCSAFFVIRGFAAKITMSLPMALHFIIKTFLIFNCAKQ